MMWFHALSDAGNLSWLTDNERTRLPVASTDFDYRAAVGNVIYVQPCELLEGNLLQN